MKSLMNVAFSGTLALASMLAIAPSAMAGPIYTFTSSVGTQPSNVGKVTLVQNDANSVIVYAELLSGYGFLNTGGPHTPFAFNLSGSGALSIDFDEPLDGIYAKGVFSLNTSGGSATPYGSFGIAIDDSAGNGSSNAYFGDLEFTLTRVGGLSTDDFVKNGASGYYFAADLTDGAPGNTGSQAWQTRAICTVNCAGVGTTSVPEPTTLALFGAGLAGLASLRRRRKARA